MRGGCQTTGAEGSLVYRRLQDGEVSKPDLLLGQGVAHSDLSVKRGLIDEQVHLCRARVIIASSCG